MSTLVRIRAVKPLDGFVVRLDFTDGTQRDVDFEPYLHGPIFATIRRDVQLFRAIQVDPEVGQSFGATAPTSIRTFSTAA